MWNSLKNNSKSIVLYGTGDGAEKIMRHLDMRGIPVSGIFASDGFVRTPRKIFHGFEVLSYAEAREKFGDMAVLVCFGSDRPEVIENVKRIASEQELYAPDVPVAGTDIFDREYYMQHRKDADEVYELLADEQSRRVFKDIIEYKLTGRLDPLFRCETPDSELWELLSPGTDESYLDLGAYTGDTVREFISVAGTYKEIFAFEPDKRNYRKLTENILRLHDTANKIHCYNIAAYSHKTELHFTRNAGRGNTQKLNGTPLPSNGFVSQRTSRPQCASEQPVGTQMPSGEFLSHKKLVRADSIDNLLADKCITLVKIDVEGFESEAILGMKELISKKCPKMLIAAYHKSGDLWDIPKQILDLSPKYKIYLRHSPCIPAWEVNYIFV